MDPSVVLKRLNVAYVNGCLLVAAGFAYAAGSWVVFPALLTVTLGQGLYSGEIRLPAEAR